MTVTTSTNVMKKLSSKNIVSPKGFKAAGLHCGLKHKKKDLALLVSEVPASVAGVFTTNAVQAAPLKVTKEVVYATKKMQAMIVNSGNANACTGKQGVKDAQTMQALAAEKLGIAPNLVGVCSTGVIGEMMKLEPVANGILQLEPKDNLESAIDFAQAILTTDTVMKNTSYSTTVDGKEVIIAGVAKGSGMIEPNMATMLGFITTDANIESEVLQAALSTITNLTFNAITVDGDTSTNDTVVILANGLAGNHSLTPEHPDWQNFFYTLQTVAEDLAKMIAKDGEGATKLIEVEVVGAISDEEARKIAKTVVGSPLVKTAVFGCDANWGRIIAAVGYSGATVDPDKITIQIGGATMVENGEPIPFSEDELIQILKMHEVKIYVSLGVGDGKGHAWGCDLTYDYVQINASYRS
ncbi:bifunctional glutamate N-acetyltransferase/amino-acid acetyltransferase ArgJ [Lysinibacillus capsici]|uniref:bifunctional glutamate N-acetyltransferase/amino-acid acetyltransferase ArgJ n=1 Tax=Lysinibacillus capsici TaxID=2115968 RepID=UPI0001DA558E|nr:bifunctional glutamate N-acetyltransferase/amino-acid acetyltransferase ArgJ [Lysinibacillus capsici]EFI69736.1 arginine biosynthesis bifunctional glutamate N-acetyltransferase/amino-acid acetyltransferase [Lysinibacillus fusiformis ZC1]EKU42814.1 arginine biosynthesis bifunctional glutamate N-acetyltransferase/amino-acid acetyltransferase [Lysinibacillus fusiformis ZB2]MBU5250681.1 bifunctional glutamate N-acetyltransferase/amino-acid acetyltransferase ArgJ [Lysinibacillus capsici]MED469857